MPMDHVPLRIMDAVFLLIFIQKKAVLQQTEKDARETKAKVEEYKELYKKAYHVVEKHKERETQHRIIIKLESSGPILYKQERVGLNNKPFNVVKFRSMRTDAEKDGIPRWATAGDSRVTRVGKVIRKLRIDELPQLFSVLNGDMSLVGPRPERAFFVEKLTQEIPFYAVRHSVKPGVTGWAQVRYQYGSTVEDTAEKLQYDLYYVKNHSLFLDLVVIFETVGVVLTGKGAQ